MEDWNGYPHFATADYSAHFYYFETNGVGEGVPSYWQLDSRDQLYDELAAGYPGAPGTIDWYDGGYVQVYNPWDLED